MCVCECACPACLYPCQSSFVLSQGFRESSEGDGMSLTIPLPLARTRMDHLLPSPLHLPTPPYSSEQSMNWKPRAEEEWFDYLPDLCRAGKWVDPHAFLQYPFGAFLNVSPKEPSCGSAKSASRAGCDSKPSGPSSQHPHPSLPLSHILFITNNNYWQ